MKLKLLCLGVVMSVLASAYGLAQDPGSSLPRVVVLTTGGTIASRYDPEQGGLVPAVTGDELLAAVPELGELARVEVESVANIVSSNMTPELWLELSRRASGHLEREDVAGVIVTHGTDTMEESAYFLDLTVASEKPIVMVGAQRAASFPDTDGPRNLLNAVRVAVSAEAVGKGTMVVMNGQINAAREVTKTSTLDVGTFQSIEFGLLGVADLEKVRFYRAPVRRQTIELPREARLGRVEIVAHYAGADGSLIRGVLDRPEGLDGLVIAALGVGNVGEKMFEAIREARDRGIPVVVSTRVYTGRIMPLYAPPGSGISLRNIGCIFADNLSPQKARVLLVAALTRTRDPVELQAYFDR